MAPQASRPSAPARKARIGRYLIAISVCLLVIAMEFLRPAFDRRLDESFRDTFLRLTASSQPEDRLVIVDINDEAIRTVGPWPWSRGQIADLLEILLADYGARAIALDMVFPEASAHDPDGELRLAQLLKHGPISIAQVLDYTDRPEQLAQGVLLATPLVPANKPEHPVPAHGFIANHPGLAESRCAGNIGYQPDKDGVLRHIPLWTQFRQDVYPHLALSLLICADPRAPAPAYLPNESWWRLPFRRSLDAFTVIPAAELLRGEVDTGLVHGRYVLVGSSSLSIGDRVSTPLAPLVSGVLLHAEASAALLDLAAGTLPPARDGTALLLCWSVLSLAVALYWITRWPAWRSVALLLFFALFWVLIAFWGIRQQYDLSVTPPLWGYFLLLLFAVPHEWRQSQRQIQRVTETLSHYVAKPVLDELLRRGISYSLEPQLREVTVLIADMEAYTRTTSSLPLEEAASLTKAFLDNLTRPVLNHGGTLDRYSGDGLVAFWGAPLDCPEQADQAVSAALDMLDAIARFNVGWTAAGHAPVRARIGIESGLALVGDLGTPFRSTYTAVGDCINFASRLEAAARDLPVSLVIGASARSRLQKHQTYPLTTLQVRGTEHVLEVFSVQSPA